MGCPFNRLNPHLRDLPLISSATLVGAALIQQE
jgi:hypothetical protein